MNLCVVWQFECDRSAGQHDERQGGLGAVEPVRAVDHVADLVVQSFVASVGQVDRGGDAAFVIADRAGGFDEFRDPRSLSPGAPAVQR